MEMILFGIFLAPFVLIIAYHVLVVTIQVLVMLYTTAFSAMGWDVPRQYARDNWGL